MSPRLEDRDGVTIAHLVGRITIGTELAAVQQLLEPALAAPSGALVVDLHDVVYIDSAALGEFVACRRRLLDAGRPFALARARGKVKDLLDLTRLDRVITVFDSIESAVAALGKATS